jgi:hypothetical protein
VGGLTATFTLTELTPQPVVLTITGGSPQTTPEGAAFLTPLAVHVADGFGNARPGVVVTYIPPTSGASATLSAGTASTDSLGNASLTASANSTLGTYNVQASVGGVSVNFALTNSPTGTGSPASIAATAGTPQTQYVHDAFPTAFQVLVKDSHGNPLSGASVTFAAPLTGASGTFAGSASVTTNANGFATAPAFTANTVSGSYQVTAAAGTVSTTFNLTNAAGSPVTMNIYAGYNQSATINTAFGTPLAVQLLDTYGNPVGSNWGNTSFIEAAGTSGASATFSGSISVGADNNGVYTAPTLTANGIAGALNVLAYYLNASTNSALYQTFTLTNTTSVPAAVTATSGTPQSTAVGTAFAAALSAKVTDSGNNPLAGFTVTFVPPSSGASATLSSSSAITNSAGVASVTATANSLAGPYSITASVGSFAATFALTNTVSTANKCDVNLDGVVNVLDAQQMINEALGVIAAGNDLNQDGVVNVVDLQIVINAALGLGCAAK